MPRTYVHARSQRRNDGSHAFQCGHETCRAPIGWARPPFPLRRPGVSIAELDVKLPAGANLETDWILHAPQNRNVSAAPGFSKRRSADGQIIYAVIPPQPQRDQAGAIIRDEQGQPLPRQGGRRRSRRDWATGYDEAHGIADRLVHGHLATLPCIVRCAACGECSTVIAPDD
ncbi:MAG: hypothetical protein K0Q71_5847 [Thermomicrobiales bacterium]|jgi:hypothetical protein|nr:hypothetical protein [Thermomicrobiales bacterium]